MGASTVNVASGATLQLDDDTGIKYAKRSLILNGSGTANSGALSSSSGDNEWTGSISLASDSTVSVLDNSLILSGIVSGLGGFAKSGSGDLTLSAANDFTGATTVSEGAVTLTGSLASACITIASSLLRRRR